MDAQTKSSLYAAEMGDYFRSISRATPVGVCTQCAVLRTRAEMSVPAAQSEICPASMLAANPQGHAWQGFHDKESLRQWLQANGETIRTLIDQAETRFPAREEQ